MKKVKEIISNSKVKVALAATTVMCAAPIANAFADDAVQSAVTSSMTGIKTDLLGVIAAVAPIAVAIFGATFVWKKGVKFFSSIANK